MVQKTQYQIASGAEELCSVCPYRGFCPKADSDSFECPARVNERHLVTVIAGLKNEIYALETRCRELETRCDALGDEIDQPS